MAGTAERFAEALVKGPIFLWLVVAAAAAPMAVGSEASSTAEQAPAVAPAGVAGGDAHDVLFNEQWKFFKGDDAKAKESAFDDADWRTLDLPHDWSIEGPFDPKLASCTAFLPCGIGWYRKTFTVPAEAANQSVRIRFDGVMNHSTVWCNGQQVGERPYGYSTFTCDLTAAIKPGGQNVIAVRVDHEQYADSRWYAGSGIYRNVFLAVTDKLHVQTNGTFVTTPNASADSATADVETVVKNDGSGITNATVVTSIEDPAGATVASLEETAPVAAGGEKQITAVETFARPELWSPDHPVLYTVETQIKKAGAVVDEYRTPFGIRTIVFDPDKGLSINGQSMKLKGVCIHHDAGALGAAVPIQVWERRLKILREAGCNAIRCSHNPPAPEFLDLCDRMGFLVMDEAFDEWTAGKHKWVVGHNVGKPSTDGYHEDFDKWADIDIRDMVLRDRNHPSIIMWSIGNEIDYTHDPFPPNSPELPPIAARLIKDVKAVDTTRPVTAACAFPATNLFKPLLDIEGYNYMEKLYAGDHAAHPDRVIYGSENAQTAAAWLAVVQNDYIAGQFLWAGFDYLGEAGVWPAHASTEGMIDLAGFPKNLYYLRKSLWTEAPMVYLSTTGLGKGFRGAEVAPPHTLFCFTNCDSIELFHDGQSLGTKPHTIGQIITWPLDFTSGTLKAIGRKGDATTTFELKKAGAPAKIVIEPDVSSLAATGRDVAQIEVHVTDEAGTLVPDATNHTTCTLTGPARVLGIENGNVDSTEDYKALSHSLYQGRMLIYVQSLKSPGEVKLTVSSPGLDASSVTLPVR
jgi:beta-galactosidase